MILKTNFYFKISNLSYWGSYDLTIPGGSGAGSAVKHLSLPDNAPDFFKFAAFNRQPLQAKQVKRPASQPVQGFQQASQQTQQFRQAPQTAQQFIQAPQPAQQFRQSSQPAQQITQAPQPAQQFRQAPQQFRAVQSGFSFQTVIGSSQQKGTIPASTQNLRVFAPPAPTQRIQTAPTEPRTQSQRFQTRPQPRPQPRPVKPTQQSFRQTAPLSPAETSSPVSARNYVHDVSGDNQLSRFQLYQLRKKNVQVGQDVVNNEVEKLSWENL